MNLNGDYISDMLAAQVGGIGIAPGANINYVSGHAIFEATHGIAPDIAGKDKVNPSSIILSAVMMLDYIGWKEAGPLDYRCDGAIVRSRLCNGRSGPLYGPRKVCGKQGIRRKIDRNIMT